MRFASCEIGDRQFAGLIDGDSVRPLLGISELGSQTPSEILESPPLADEQAIPLSEVVIRPVVPRPGKILCLGLNYAEHVAEGTFEIPKYPVLFTKFWESLVGAGAPILLPPESKAPDYEAELAVVIGRNIRRASVASALDSVAGYTIANDVTMRDFQYRSHQWLQGKSWANSTPLGPFLVTPEEVGDPHDLDIRLELNGLELQSANTSMMIFDIPTVLAAISEFVPLAPGDVVLTGTPSGVGIRREPRVLLADGDRVVVEIERLGRLDNPVKAEDVSRDPAAAGAGVGR
jgi:acylpyruvate hydrolase